MANICWFEMRIRGSKANCNALLETDIRCYDMYLKAENGTDDDYMMYLRGECAWSVAQNMIYIDKEESLAAKAAKLQLEIEICGLDESCECMEHFHYKGDKVVKENNLTNCFPAWMVDEGEISISEEDLKKYTKDESADMYILKDEFAENFTYDYDLDEAVFNFEMSFRDLPGLEDYED